MKNDRLRVPIDDPYLHAAGLAMICFARLEWDAIWCCEKLETGCINKLAKKTAGDIAEKLIKLAKKHPKPAVIASLGTAATEFDRLVRRRNDLFHATPATSGTGEQRLFRYGAEWTIALLEEVADEFAAASDVLNHHLHNLL